MDPVSLIPIHFEQLKELRDGTISYLQIIKRDQTRPPVRPVCRKLGVSKLSEIPTETDLYQALVAVAHSQVAKLRETNAGVVTQLPQMASTPSALQSQHQHNQYGRLFNPRHIPQDVMPIVSKTSSAASSYSESHSQASTGRSVSLEEQFRGETDLRDEPEVKRLIACILAARESWTSKKNIAKIAADFMFPEYFVSLVISRVCELLECPFLSPSVDVDSIVWAVLNQFHQLYIAYCGKPFVGAIASVGGQSRVTAAARSSSGIPGVSAGHETAAAAGSYRSLPAMNMHYSVDASDPAVIVSQQNYSKSLFHGLNIITRHRQIPSHVNISAGDYPNSTSSRPTTGSTSTDGVNSVSGVGGRLNVLDHGAPTIDPISSSSLAGTMGNTYKNSNNNTNNNYGGQVTRRSGTISPRYAGGQTEAFKAFWESAFRLLKDTVDQHVELSFIVEQMKELADVALFTSPAAPTLGLALDIVAQAAASQVLHSIRLSEGCSLGSQNTILRDLSVLLNDIIIPTCKIVMPEKRAIECERLSLDITGLDRYGQAQPDGSSTSTKPVGKPQSHPQDKNIALQARRVSGSGATFKIDSPASLALDSYLLQRNNHNEASTVDRTLLTADSLRAIRTELENALKMYQSDTEVEPYGSTLWSLEEANATLIGIPTANDGGSGNTGELTAESLAFAVNLTDVYMLECEYHRQCALLRRKVLEMEAKLENFFNEEGGLLLLRSCVSQLRDRTAFMQVHEASFGAICATAQYLLEKIESSFSSRRQSDGQIHVMLDKIKFSQSRLQSMTQSIESVKERALITVANTLNEAGHVDARVSFTSTEEGERCVRISVLERDCSLHVFRSIHTHCSRLMQAYLNLDRKISVFVTFIRKFAHLHRIDTELDSYGWVVLCVHVLLHHSFLPSLQRVHVKDRSSSPLPTDEMAVMLSSLSTRIQHCGDWDVSIVDTEALVASEVWCEYRDRIASVSVLELIEIFSRYITTEAPVYSGILTTRAQGKHLSKYFWSNPKECTLWRLSLEDPFQCIGSVREVDLGAKLSPAGMKSIFASLTQLHYATVSLSHQEGDDVSDGSKILGCLLDFECLHRLATQAGYQGPQVSAGRVAPAAAFSSSASGDLFHSTALTSIASPAFVPVLQKSIDGGTGASVSSVDVGGGFVSSKEGIAVAKTHFTPVRDSFGPPPPGMGYPAPLITGLSSSPFFFTTAPSSPVVGSGSFNDSFRPQQSSALSSHPVGTHYPRPQLQQQQQHPPVQCATRIGAPPHTDTHGMVLPQHRMHPHTNTRTVHGEALQIPGDFRYFPPATAAPVEFQRSAASVGTYPSSAAPSSVFESGINSIGTSIGGSSFLDTSTMGNAGSSFATRSSLSFNEETRAVNGGAIGVAHFGYAVTGNTSFSAPTQPGPHSAAFNDALDFPHPSHSDTGHASFSEDSLHQYSYQYPQGKPFSALTVSGILPASVSHIPGFGPGPNAIAGLPTGQQSFADASIFNFNEDNDTNWFDNEIPSTSSKRNRPRFPSDSSEVDDF